MPVLSTENRDMLHSLSWYMAARQSALRAALSFRAQLSVSDQMDMRVHYSGYFLNLLSATELCRETTALQANGFETKLYALLVFDEFENGEANYSYLRELRNAIVHRGLNITSAAHFDSNFPLVLSPPKVQNQKGTKTFVAFGKYLLEVIKRCESVVGPVMQETLSAAGFFEASIDVEAARGEYREFIEQSTVMPAEVKAMALAAEFNPEWAVSAHRTAMAKLREVLAPITTPELSAYSRLWNA